MVTVTRFVAGASGLLKMNACHDAVISLDA
jgi:hypothetical protein